jgi:hypothetical protein
LLTCWIGRYGGSYAVVDLKDVERLLRMFFDEEQEDVAYPRGKFLTDLLSGKTRRMGKRIIKLEFPSKMRD